MSHRDIWFQQAERLAEEDENADRMVPLIRKDKGTPYRPVGPPGPVRRGATWKGASGFILAAEERNRRLT